MKQSGSWRTGKNVHNEAEEAALAKRRGNFFAVDLETFRAVCALGDADAAASYLILAAGTGADNRTSTWSRQAINARTSLTWRKARDCIDKLIAAGFASWIRRGHRPRLDLPPIEPKLPAISPMAAQMVELVRAGQQPSGSSQKSAAARARELGYLVKQADGSYALPPARKLQMVWMPKELVDGAIGERPPVERVRRARDARALQLLVELYSVQNLAELAGVDRRWLIKKFYRKAGYATGHYQVWSFERDQEYVTLGKPFKSHEREPTPAETAAGINSAFDFYERLGILADAGLVEWVYYLAEDDARDGTLIHPIGVERQGKLDWSAFETIIGGYAIRAAVALGGDADGADEAAAQYHEAAAPRYFLISAERLLREARVHGVPRLRYRAKTSNAARWLNELMTDGRDYIEGYRSLIADKCPELLVSADQRLADFNDTSTLVQRMVQRDINDSLQSARNVSAPSGAAAGGGVSGDWRRVANGD